MYNRKNRKGPYVRGPMIIDVHAYLLDSFYTAINHFYHIYVPLDRIWCFHRILVIVNKSLEFTSFLYVFDRVLVHWEEDWKLPLLESSPSEMWSPSEEARRERPRGSSGMKEDSAMSLEELAHEFSLTEQISLGEEIGIKLGIIEKLAQPVKPAEWWLLEFSKSSPSEQCFKWSDKTEALGPI